MSSSRRRVLQIGGAVAVLAALALALRPSPLPVEAAPVRRARLTVTIDEEGMTRVRDRFVVAAPVAGQLQRIDLDAGDEVHPGQVLARMSPLPLDARALAEARARTEAAEAGRREADARVEQARAALEQAGREAERAHKLARGGTISAGERERAELELTTRQKELEASLFAARAAEFNLSAARAALIAAGGPGSDGTGGILELTSPAGGHVLRVMEESERTVAFGTPLIEVGDPSSLEIVVDLLTSDAVHVRPGAVALIHDWGGGESLEARVRRIEPSAFTKVSALGVEEQRVNVIADFTAPQPQLGDGYRVEARIVVWQADDVLIAPASALFRHGGAWHVFVVEGGVARRRRVGRGHGNALEVEILDGLAESESVILHPSDLVDDGVRVRAG